MIKLGKIVISNYDIILILFSITALVLSIISFIKHKTKTTPPPGHGNPKIPHIDPPKPFPWWPPILQKNGSIKKKDNTITNNKPKPIINKCPNCCPQLDEKKCLNDKKSGDSIVADCSKSGKCPAGTTNDNQNICSCDDYYYNNNIPQCKSKGSSQLDTLCTCFTDSTSTGYCPPGYSGL
jgi:hypothetical protein